MGINWAEQAEKIAHYYGHGKEHKLGDESWMTLCPQHNDENKPNLHVTAKDNKILLHCHVCGEQGAKEITKKIKEHFDIGMTRGAGTLSKNDRGLWLTPVPTTAPARPTTCYINPEIGARTPDALWAYLDQNKKVLMYNARFNIANPDGSIDKVYRRLALYTHKDDSADMRWSWYGPDTAMPLYGLEQLVDEWWKKTVLFVEGEKAADAARLLFPEMIVLTFPGGAKHYPKVDWKPLFEGNKLEHALLWPDNDRAGREMSEGPGSLPAFLLKNGKIKTRVINVFDCPELPPKWDLADPLPETWSTDNLYGLIGNARYPEAEDEQRLRKYCSVLSALDSEQHDLKVASKIKCEVYAAKQNSPCLNCYQYRRIDEPHDLIFMPDIQLDWIYLTRHKMFRHIRSQMELDHTGFNSLWGSHPQYTLTGPTSAASTLLADDRTTKVYDIDYVPQHPRILINTHEGTKHLNTWKGFALKPGDEVPVQWLALGEYLFHDEAVREHIYNWLAFLLQHPDQKINHGLLILSETQGVGKDSFFQPIRMILGSDNYRDISSRSLDSTFNEYLLQTKLLIVNELDTIGHRHSTYDYMKTLLASPPTTLNINVKGLREIKMANLIQVIAFSNKEVPVAIEDSDRRLMVYNIRHSKNEMWPATTFSTYYDWLQSGGSRDVFGWLLKRDISAFNPSKPALHTLDKASLAAAKDLLATNIVEAINNFHRPFDRDIITSQELMDYISQGVKRRGTQAHVEKILQKNNAGRFPTYFNIGGKRVFLIAVRHFDFWCKQTPETVKRAFEKGWVGMSVPKDQGTAPPEQNFGF